MNAQPGKKSWPIWRFFERKSLPCNLTLRTLLCCTGPVVFRHVKLQAPKQKGWWAGVKLKVTDPDVQEALRIVDEIVGRNGLVLDYDRPTSDDPVGKVYATTQSSRPLGSPLHCYVYLKRGRLDVELADFGQRHFSPEAQKIRDELVERFSAKFGKDRVR